MLNVAILGFWHVHATDYADEALRHPGVRVAAVWDEDEARGRAAAERYAAPFHERLNEVLGRPDIDAVVVTTATADHRRVIDAAAGAGKHLFTEKVLATTVAEARAIAATCERAGVVLTVSLPRLAAGYAREIKADIAQGRLGRVTAARVRVAHNGAVRTAAEPEGWLPGRFFDARAAGGGALIDLGCHPVYLLRWFLGMPDGISASYGSVTGRGVEDNAVATLRYADGTLGVAESSFVSGVSSFGIEIHGTEGSAVYRWPEGELWRYRPTGGGAMSSQGGKVPPEADLPSPFSQWVQHIERGTRATENVAIAIDLSALMEAANRSAAEGREVRLAEGAEDDAAAKDRR